MFFRQFPRTEYDVFHTGSTISVTDIFRNVSPDQAKLASTVAYQKYTIQNGDRPDVVSQKLYQDPNYHWTFFIVNESLKAGISGSWPMTATALDDFITRQYDAYSVSVMTETVLIDGIQFRDSTGLLISQPAYTTLTAAEVAAGVGLYSGVKYDMSSTTVNHLNTTIGLDLESNPNVRMKIGSDLVRIALQKSDMSQIWTYRNEASSIEVLDSTTAIGYLRPPRVIVPGSNNIILEAVLTSNQVAGFRILDPGHDLVESIMSASLIMDDTPDISATGDLVISGGYVTGVKILTPGIGYKRVPTVSVSGSPANVTGNISLDSSGRVTSTGSGSVIDITPILWSSGMTVKFVTTNSIVIVNINNSNDAVAGLGTGGTFELTVTNPFPTTDLENYNIEDGKNNIWLADYASWRAENTPAFPDVTTFSPSAQIDIGRNAPYQYLDFNGNQVTAQEYLSRGLTSGPILYSEHETEVNARKAQILVVRPEDVRAFAQTYRGLMNA